MAEIDMELIREALNEKNRLLFNAFLKMHPNEQNFKPPFSNKDREEMSYKFYKFLQELDAMGTHPIQKKNF